MTSHSHKTDSLLKSSLCALSIVVAAALVGGCDSGPAGSHGSAANMTAEARIEGNISDVHGQVTQGKLEVIRYDRATGWQGVRLTALDATLDLPALGAGVSIPLADIYRWTPLAPA